MKRRSIFRANVNFSYITTCCCCSHTHTPKKAQRRQSIDVVTDQFQSFSHSQSNKNLFSWPTIINPPWQLYQRCLRSRKRIWHVWMRSIKGWTRDTRKWNRWWWWRRKRIKLRSRYRRESRKISSWNVSRKSWAIKIDSQNVSTMY